MMSAFEIACFLLLFSAVSLSTAAPEQDGKLHILSLSSDKLRAVYHLSAQEGIEITSQVSEEESHLSITTLAGEQLVSARSVADSSDIFWKIMGYSIFLHNNSLELQDGGTQRDMLEYVVPSTAADHVEKEMKKHHITPKLLRTLNTEIVEQTKQSAFLELFSRPEMDGVMAAVRVLGNTIKGYENPAALNLYSVALNFGKLRTRISNGLLLGPSETRLEREDQTTIPSRKMGKRATCSHSGFWGAVYTYECSQCHHGDGNECLGMCGYGCYCWDWVCGDCCHYQGCYEHDICCRNNGFFDQTCILVFPFSCSGYQYQC